MKVKELLKVLLSDQKAVLTHLDSNDKHIVKKTTIGLLQYETDLMDLDVTIVYYSTTDNSYHIITAHQ